MDARLKADQSFATRKFLNYVNFVSGHWYKVGAHHRLIAHHLERVISGECKRLIVTMPPRHGKSELVSIHFPAYFLGKFPDRDVIAASYGSELADDFGRQVRNLTQSDEHRRIFPDSVLAEDSTAAHRFNTIQGGAYRAAGTAGSVTGRGADLLLIDDPVKDRKAAESPTKRKDLMDWYRSTAHTRLSPEGAIVIVMTRWNEADLVGGVLNMEDREDWTVLHLPAIRENPVTKQRRALWAKRGFTLEWLDKKKAAIGSREFEALYQGNPKPWFVEGAMWPRELIEQTRAVAGEHTPVYIRTAIGVDPPAKSLETSDECGIVMASLGENGHGYVRADRSARLSPAKWARRVIELAIEYDAQVLVVETNQGGEMVAQTIRSQYEAMRRHADGDEIAALYLATGRQGDGWTLPPIAEVHAKIGKMLRAEPVLTLYENNRVHHVGTHIALENEMCSWVPDGLQDSPNRLDALVYALRELKITPDTSTAIIRYYQQEAARRGSDAPVTKEKANGHTRLKLAGDSSVAYGLSGVRYLADANRCIDAADEDVAAFVQQGAVPISQ